MSVLILKTLSNLHLPYDRFKIKANLLVPFLLPCLF